MPFKSRLKQLERRYSWPPLKNIMPQRKIDIDEDPFAFFISPADDILEYGAHLNADIELLSRPQSLSPRLVQNKDKLMHSPAIEKLKRWVQRMEGQYFHKRLSEQPLSGPSLPTPPDSPIRSTANKRPAPVEEEAIEDEDDRPMLDVFEVTVSPPLRGRRPTRASRRRYGNKMVRSHSKRARVWKEPDEDIWPVIEEPEDNGLGIYG